MHARSPRGRRLAAPSLPRISCDFNSVGWSGDDDDECYYSFDEKGLAQHHPKAGMRIFIYETSRDDLVMGCEARLEEYRDPISDQSRWRLRAIPNTGYLGGLK
jgi:hypothetical protein